MNRVTKTSAAWFVAMLVCLGGSVDSEAATRVALVSTCGGDAGANILSLAEAKLSSEKEIVLVGRANVERVLDEQKLWRCGLSDSAQALAAGKLLGVEVFASLETLPGGKEVLGLVVFDATSGVRLADTALPGGGPEKATEALLRAVRDAIEKRQKKTNSLRTVCLLSVRNAELPREMDSFCESVGRLLERRLLSSASLALLERARLDQVTVERSLPTTHPASNLLPSLTMLELEFERAGEHGIRATAFLTDAAGTALGKTNAVAKAGQAVELVEALLAIVTEMLHVQPVHGAVDRAREAERFRQEAKFRADHHAFGQAVMAAEAACALDPGGREYRRIFASYLVSHAVQLSVRDAARSVASLERALAIWEEIQHDSGTVNFEREIFSYLASSAGSDPRALSLRRRYRALCLTEESRAFERAQNDSQAFGRYGDVLRWTLERTPRCAEGAGEQVRLLRGFTQHWLKLIEQYGLGPTWSLSLTVDYLTVRQVVTQPQQKTGTTKLDPTFLEGMAEIFHSMQSHSHSVIQLYGMYGAIWLDAKEKRIGPIEIRAGVDQLERRAREQIQNAQGESADATRYLTYLAILDSLDLISNLPERAQRYQNLFEFMMGRNELVPYVVWAATAPVLSGTRSFGRYWAFANQRPDKEEAARLVRNWERVVAAYDSAEVHKLDGGGEFAQAFTRGEIAKQQRDALLAAMSEIKQPWHTARLLLDGRAHGCMLLSPFVAVRGDSAYVLGLTGSNTWKLIAVSLRDSHSRLLGEIRGSWSCHDLTKNLTSPGNRWWGVSEMGDIAADDESVYVATCESGMLIFPNSGGSVQRISTTNGLPSASVHSIAVLDGKLYAGLGKLRREAYFVSYSLESGTCEIIASSQRKEKRTALDDLPPFRIKAIRADPANHRLLLVLDFDFDVNSRGDYTPQIGIWEYVPQSAKLRQVTQLNRACRWVGLLRHNEVLLAPWSANPWQPGRMYRPWYGIVSFNLHTDTPKIRYAKHGSPAGPGLEPDADTLRSEVLVEPPYLLQNGWLWGAEGRISADGKRYELYPSLPTNASTPTKWRFFEPVNEAGKVIAGDEQSLWLLELSQQ